MYGGVYGSYLQGIEKIANFRRWEILTGLTGYLFCCLVLLVGGGLLELVIASQAGTLIQIAINRRLAFRFTAGSHWQDVPRFDRNLMRSVWPAAWRSGLGVFINQGTILLTGIIYVQLVPPQAAASYLLALRVIQVIIGVANVPFYVRLPMLARLYASGHQEKLIAVGRRGMLLANWIFVGGVCAVFLAGEKIVDLINRDTTFVSLQLWALLSVALLVQRIGAMHLQLYSTTNHIVWHIVSGVSGLIVLSSMPFAYSRYGVLGFPLSILVGYAVFYAPYSIKLSYGAFRMKFAEMDLVVSVPPFLVTVFLFLTSSAGKLWELF